MRSIRSPRVMNRVEIVNAPTSSSRHSASGPSQRQLRVGELIRHALAEMLSRGEIHDPTIEAHMITVPEVRMTAICGSPPST